METFKAVVPLLAVILTAVLSGYIVPRLTRQWQDHQKALEIKTSLAEEINRAVVQIILAMQLSERGALPQKAFDEAYQDWETERAVLSSRARVYMPNTAFTDGIERYFDAVGDFYALGGIQSGEYRRQQIRKLSTYFGETATDWAKLVDLDKRRTDFFDWFFAWWSLRQAALRRKDVLIQRLLVEPMRLAIAGQRKRRSA
jgi:hypothetical protein